MTVSTNVINYSSGCVGEWRHLAYSLVVLRSGAAWRGGGMHCGKTWWRR